MLPDVIGTYAQEVGNARKIGANANWRRRDVTECYSEATDYRRAARPALRRVGAGARADIRGPAGAVFDHDRLPPAPVQFLAEDTHEDVAGAAGAHRHDRLDRPARIVLRPRRACERHDRAASDETTQAAHTGVLPPRFRAVTATYGGPHPDNMAFTNPLALPKSSLPA